jgi:DNA-binding transcriptional LysR family regulator
MLTIEPDLFRGVVPFVAVADALSFRRAAASLGLTPAAVSKAVQTLEATLGVTLLERTSRAVSLTRDGELFYERCKGAVAAVSGARAEMASARKAPHGEAVISAPFVLVSVVVAAIVALRHRHPRLLVRLQVSDRIASFSADRVDVAARIGEGEDESLHARKLRGTRWTTVASPAYLARRPAPAQPADLDAHECLVFVGPNGRPRAWHFSTGAVVPRAVLETDHGPAMLDAARAGVGICQVFDLMVEDELRRGSLVRVLPELAVAGPALTAVWSASRRAHPNVRAIVDALGAAFADR